MQQNSILYVTDLDGTLLQPDVTVSERSFRILSELLDKGLPLTVATARTSFSVMPILRGLPFRLPLILQNGAVLHDPVTDRVVSAAPIQPDAFLQVLALFRTFGFNGFVFCVPEKLLECCYTELTTPHMRKYYQERKSQYHKPFRQVLSLTELAAETPVFMSLNAPKERLDPLRGALGEIGNISVAYYRDVYEPGIWYLEVSASEATKYHGVCRLRELTGARTVVGFGDNHNDFPLFRACDIRIAVGNAADELKEKADRIIARNTEDAVALFLRQHFQPADNN
ncbi:MAG: HAD-IIB family hydrolase [Oscillospiraceae bacterium]|nr:HAD-IIB family hydrolase [Oscillospiraceae bacterium]